MTTDTPARASGPPTASRHVALRPVYPTDHEYLYTLANRPGVAWQWRYRGASPPIEQFVHDLWESTLVHFVVTRADDGARIGYIQAFDASERNRWCHFALMLDPEHAASPQALECVPLFFNYVFTIWDLDRLYAVALEPVYERWRHYEGAWFVTEGCMKEHEWCDGAYRDLYLLTVRRDDWAKAGPGLVAELITSGGRRPS